MLEGSVRLERFSHKDLVDLYGKMSGSGVHGCAVRVGDDALVTGDRVGVDFRHYERCVRVHAEDGGVVDDDAASLSGLRRPLLREGKASEVSVREASSRYRRALGAPGRTVEMEPPALNRAMSRSSKQPSSMTWSS
eukprot:COSAG03_NODE_2127_length_3095_cov_255.712617_3_plen_136_part_00